MRSQFSLSKLSVLIIFIAFCVFAFNNKKWQKEEVLCYDSMIYYTYLPATFIYHDLSLDFIFDLPPTLANNIWHEK
ncbi:MAG TPA: hypothetical protein PKM40_02800, partial [Bacteroidia bacterium]|nr:hypothetical protein [Bacteroidia bacterium]